MATTEDGAATITPNDAFRRVRQLYVGCVGTAIPLLFLAFYLTVERIGHGILPTILVIVGMGLLLISMLMRAAATCPRCGISLIWKRGPIGTGRISLGEKSHCPGCGLDLNVPYEPEKEPGTPVPGEGDLKPT